MGQQNSKGFGEAEDNGSILYFGIAIGMLIITAVTIWFTKMKGAPVADGAQDQQRNNNAAAQGNRRQVGVRARRGRRVVDDSDSDGGGEAVGGAGRRAQVRDSDGSDRELDIDERLNDPKLGAKKRAKLEAKMEKRAQRESEERVREDKKVRQAREETDRKLREEQEGAAEKKREEEEKRQKEEQIRKEQEEYEKMKEMFSIDETGCDTIEEEEQGNMLQMFLDHIKQHKVVMFDELASKFGLKVPDAIDRLKHLVEEGRLTGVMDDRGKFIYIPQEELLQFAKFIKQRGRVAISDLVENSASLINLKPIEAES